MVAVLLAGLVLPAWWLLTAHPRGLPGLGDFPSAYLGDSVLLPAGCLVLLLGIRLLAPARRERRAAVVAALVAAVAAVGVQAEWLEDPTTQLDWTMPSTGHFDAAGWWHAAYFTGMSMVLLVLVIVFLARIRAARRAAQQAVTALSSGTGAAAVLTAWGSYAALAIHDYLSGPAGTSSSISSFALAGTVVLAAAAMTGFAYGREALILARPLLLAAAGIAVITSLATARPPVQVVAAALVAGAAVAAAAVRQRRRPPAAAADLPSRRALPGWPRAGGLRARSAAGAAPDAGAPAPAQPPT